MVKNNAQRFFSNIRLGWKLSILIVLIVLMMGFMTNYFVRLSLKPVLREELSKKGFTIASTLAANALEPILLENQIKLQQLLHNTKAGDKDVRYAFVLDGSGKIVAHTFKKGFPRRLAEINIPEPGKPYRIQRLDSEEGFIDDIAVPILEGKAVFVRVGITETFITQTISSIEQSVIGVTVLTSLAGMILAFLAVNFLLVPLGNLARGVREFGEGKLKSRITSESNDEIGMLVQFFNTMADNLSSLITEVQNSAEALETEKNQLAVTLHSIGEGVITTDIEGKIVLVNKAAEKLTGWDQYEASGQRFDNVFRIIDEYNRKHHENPVTTVLAIGKTVTLYEGIILLSRDSSEYLINASVAPILDSNNNILGTVLVFQDVTAERKMEEELIKAEKLESLGLLAGGIAHDFNNILTGILGNISLARRYIDEKSMAGNRLTAAENACTRAQGLTQQLITFARGGAPIKQKVYMNELLQETVHFVLSGTNVKCDFSLADDLSPVEVDKGQMSQVISNLVINAVQAMPEGGKVNISSENTHLTDSDHMDPLPEGLYIKITVSDRGCGIPQTKTGRIFDPYFTTKKGGSGLGLTSTYSIIKRHGGAITVDSQAGKGTTFTFFLKALTS
jgi:PAS domain S-box-containing protein